jgi:hypothetical protein
VYQVGEALKHNLLDLLVDAPSSFAALYGGLIQHCGYPAGISVSLVLDTLLEMEHQGWVKATQMAEDSILHNPTEEDRKRDLVAYQTWLPNATFQELSIDEVGLWYELTTEGQIEWRRWVDSEEREASPRWMLDDLSGTQTLIIEAVNLDVADRVLRWWLSNNMTISLVGSSKSIETVSSFVLRDGTVIHGGIKLICRYQNLVESANQPAHNDGSY